MSLRQRIENHLKSAGGWTNGGEIERLAMNAGFKSSNASRRLRELESGIYSGVIKHDPKIAVRYKPSAEYKWLTDEQKKHYIPTDQREDKSKYYSHEEVRLSFPKRHYKVIERDGKTVAVLV